VSPHQRDVPSVGLLGAHRTRDAVDSIGPGEWIALARARQAVECLRNSLGANLASSSLVLSDAGSVLARDEDALVDLLRGGQGVFNIVPLAKVVAELTTTIRQSRLTSEKEHRSA
jgi:hypothetical protein